MAHILWTCDDFRPVRAVTPRVAAAIFAGRLARRQFGKRGYTRMPRRDSWSPNQFYTFQAFIGYDADDGSMVGHDEWITVRPATAQAEDEERTTVAHAAGMKAYDEGLSVNDNPFTTNAPREAWHLGWMAGQRYKGA